MNSYCLKDGVLLDHEKIWLPASTSLKQYLLEEFHESKTSGHSGVLQTYKRLGQNFFWKGMKCDVQKFVAKCLVC